MVNCEPKALVRDIYSLDDYFNILSIRLVFRKTQGRSTYDIS